jgi:MFS transporter, DHA1 family, multidrug resistance protein
MDGPTPETQMAPHVAAGPHAGMGFREFVGLTAALMALVGLTIDTMLPALPAIGRSLGEPDGDRQQLIVTVLLVGLGVGQIFYGPISDRVGRRPVLIGSAIAYVLVSIGAAMAPTFETLLVFRLLQGVTVAAPRVVAVSMVRDCYSGRQMARVMSLSLMVFLAVPVLAPSIGQVIMLIFPWRGLFASIAGFGMIVLLWIALRVPETLHPEFRRPIDARSIASAMARAFTTRQALGYMLAQTLIQGALYGFLNSVQQIFADGFHLPKWMPTVFAVIAGGMAAASLLNSRIVEQLGTRRVSHSALLGFIAVELVHAGIALSGYETVWTFVCCQVIAMFCFGLSMSNFGAMAMEPLASIAGTAASVQGVVVTTGGALIGLFIGQRFDGTTLPVTLGFAGAGIASVAIILITEGGRLFKPRMGS